ncbi:MAG TPA: hypothetical protein VEW93_10850 [Acidimicrobiales bacterium]|nr:hypothetical protein [Acidimicrobiales bacterium]
METEAGTTTEPERWAAPGRPAPWRLRATLAGAAAVVVLVILAHGEAATRPGDGEALLAAVVGAASLPALAALAGRARGRVAPGLLLALGGVAVVAVGSGVGRARRVSLVLAPDGLSGSSQRILQTWWPVVVLGLALVAAGVVVAWVERRPALGVDDRVRVRAVVGACVALAGGIVAIAVVLREVTGYSFISGRPERRRGRRQPATPVRATSGGRVTAAGASGPGVAAVDAVDLDVIGTTSADGPGRAPGPVSVAGDPATWWQEAAVEEAASVAAFENLAARLEAVGGPSELAQRARTAATDEVRHARACLRLAGGAPTAPVHRRAPRDPFDAPGAGSVGARPGARVPGRGLRWRAEVVGLAVESWADGVVGERSAAARLRAGAATAVDPSVGPVLRAMARDEDRHADLGADVVRWCRGQSPRLVGAVLRRAASRLPEDAPLPPSQRSADPARLRAAGLPDAATVLALWREARVVARRGSGT